MTGRGQYRDERGEETVGKNAEIAVDRIRAISKQRMKKKLDILSKRTSGVAQAHHRDVWRVKRYCRHSRSLFGGNPWCMPGHDILLDPRPTDRGDDGKNRPRGRRWNDPQGWWKEEIPG